MKRHIPKFAYLLVLIVLVTLVWGGFLYFVVKESQALGQSVSNLHLEQEKGKDRETLSQLLVKTEDARTTLETYFVREDDAAKFLERIEALATSSRVALTVTNFEKEPSGDVLRLSFKGRGTFANLYQLLRAIETMPLRIAVENLSLQAVDGMWNGIFTIRLESFLPNES